MTTPAGGPPQRVRVTSSRRGATPMHARPVSRDLDEQTELGDVYLDGLMRAQLRLCVAVIALTVAGLAALPVTLGLVPATRTITVVGGPFTWLVPGVAVSAPARSLAR